MKVRWYGLAHTFSASGVLAFTILLMFYRRFLQKKPDARVVVICPTVPLTSQQAAVFAVEGFPDQVNAFSGENPLPPPMWPAVLKKYNIMVMTPQILCSILDEGQGNFHEIDILVSIATSDKDIEKLGLVEIRISL